MGCKRTFTSDPGGLEIVDVGDPVNPVRVGGIDTVRRANGLRIVGHLATRPLVV